MSEQSGAGNYPELLEDLRTHLVGDLQRMGLDGDSERIALAVTERIRTFWGGVQIYIPKGRFVDVRKRDEEIEAAFTGTNTRALRQKYQLTERHVYRIVDQVRAARRKKLVESRNART